MAIAMALLMFGCDVCDLGEGDGNGEYSVYFTAVPLNSDIPGIFTVSEDGTGLHEIINNGILYSPPAANGRIAFMQTDLASGENQIVIAGIDGSNPEVIVRENALWDISFPILSPDGARIAFYGGRKELWLVNVSDATVNRITSNFADGTLPAFSPDGGRLVFFENVEGGVRLAMVNTFGNQNKLTLDYDLTLIDYRGESRISWAQGGSRIAFSLTSGEADYLVLVDGDLNELSRIRIDYPGVFMPDISATGEKVIFTAPDNGSLWLADLSGESPKFRDLTGSAAGEINLYPTWSDDGKYALFNKSYADDPEHSYNTLFIIEPSTRKISVLSNNAYRGYFRKN
ncbi:MAG: TolB family protein [Candidatus Kapaibacterium sp.]